jgi:plastocyanin
MSRRLTLILALLALLALFAAAPALGQEEGGGPPHPDPAFMQMAPGAPCTVENPYEATLYRMKVGDVRYGDKCERIRFAFGPIVVKPGENDALLAPITIEKPRYDGHITRFRPDLLLAATGESPPTDHMHLHHATWLNAGGSYGNGPFFASGEEKSILPLPHGYGMPVAGDDEWLLLYMVHNDQADSQVVWLTYDIDFVTQADAEELGLAPTKPIWLDVQGDQIHPEAPSTSANPVFNVQRGFGSVDPETGRLVCTWPKQNCARHDTYGQVTPQQGMTRDSDGKKIRIPGADWEVSEDMAGTVVAIGGHLHFGGIRDEVSLVRNGKERPIYISDAFYWAHEEGKRAKDRIGAPPTSWDFSMGGSGAPWWKVKIRAGDRIRLNAVTDSQDGSWYEGMGIVMAWVAPEDPHKPAGIDPFARGVRIGRGYPRGMLIPKGPYDPFSGWRPDPCRPDYRGATKTLCLRGGPTHGPMDESANHNGGCKAGRCAPLPDLEGAVTNEIVSAGFSYGNADMGVIGTQGLPLLRKGEPVRFWNLDAGARIWHTFTRCKAPCTGPKDMDYPYANGGRGDPADVMDFDSSEIGFGTFFEPPSGQIPPNNKSWDKTIRDAAYWEFTPTEEGTYTFFCRIHKSMRGAFKVVE